LVRDIGRRVKQARSNELPPDLGGNLETGTLADIFRKFNRRNSDEGFFTFTDKNPANVTLVCDCLSPRSFHVIGYERLGQLRMAKLPIRQLKLGY
jgi:hypothetical protein